MQTKLPDGSVMVCGGCSRDAELQYVGEDGKRLCKVGLAVGKRPTPDGEKPETVWCNVVAWHNVAQALSVARKGDPVLAIGRLQSREYNGKTYTDLVAEYINICVPISDCGNAPENSFPPPEKDSFSELADDGDDLPF